jgi:hypothetical protein
MEYKDFSIQISPSPGGAYQITVRSPAGKGEALLEQLPFEIDEVGGLLTGLARSLGGEETSPGAESVESEDPMRDIAVAGLTPSSAPSLDAAEVGTRLFQALFQGEIRERYNTSRGLTRGQGLRIRLNLDLTDEGLRELSRLPWEFLNSDSAGGDLGYLNLSEETPLVRDLDVSQPPDPLPFEPPLRVLVVIANPPGSTPLDLDQERETIEATFAEMEDVEVDVLEQATVEQLFDQLDVAGEYHVLHYMGHGDFDERTGRGVLLMEGEDGELQHVDGGTLAVMLHDKSDTVRLIFLNACKTAMSSREGELDPFGGVATSLIEAGIPAVVAMQFPISDRAAINFSRTFYHRLVHGIPVDTAVAAARKYLRIKQPSSKEWATPVLFMRSEDGVLFEMGPPAPEEDREEEPAEGAIPPGVDPDAEFAVWLAVSDLSWSSRAGRVRAGRVRLRFPGGLVPHRRAGGARLLGRLHRGRCERIQDHQDHLGARRLTDPRRPEQPARCHGPSRRRR